MYYENINFVIIHLILTHLNMKKIYSLIGCMLFTASTMVSQSSFMSQTNTNKMPARYIPTKQSQKVSAGVISGRFDPGYALCLANGVTDAEIGGGASGSKVGLYVTGVYCDSTTKTSFSADEFIDTHKFGMNFDPKSVIWDNFSPLLASTDAYTLDTVWVGGFYQKKTSHNDTLLVEIVWGDTSTTSTYGRYSLQAPYAYYGTFAGPKFTTTTAQGNKMFLSAPLGTNKIVIKHTLTDADSTTMNDQGYLPFVVNGTAGQLIPANNIVSCVATFIPGNPSVPVGAISYNPGSGPSPQTVNGMVARLYSQNNPATPSAGNDYFDDFQKGKNHGIYAYKRERYNMTGAFPALRPFIASAFMIDFSIHATSTVGLKEIEKNGFMLGQNVPNPFNGQSSVSYNIDKEATSAVFTVTDVMGRVISTEKADASKGTHTITLGNYSAGVYYYSLNVDGNVITKKMIAQ